MRFPNSTREKTANHAHANAQNFDRMIAYRNALYQGIFAAKKFPKIQRMLPSAPSEASPNEKFFWYSGITLGLQDSETHADQGPA